jgi:dihydrofolate reductase
LTIAIIAAAAENDVIGRSDGTIPWRIKTDSRFFKNTTMGHPMIMGRKTFETFGKPLPGRTSIVLTRDTSYVADGAVVVNTRQAALDAAAVTPGADEIFIIGGAEIYELFLPDADRVYLTRVHAQPDGEAVFTFNASEWSQLTAEPHPADPINGDDHAFTFLTFER